jgi:insulysin
MDKTVYYFNVQNDAFLKALEIFAEFFFCPILSKDAIEKEINAVNSEFLKNQNNDTWKSFHLLKTLSNPKSSFIKFGTGNSNSLNKPDIHTKVKEFYEQHYR